MLHSWQSDYFEVVDAFFGYTTVRASDSRRRGAATLPVPSQSPMPAQPESAYVRLGLDGMSAGLLRDLRNIRHSVSDFKPSPRTNARASEKERNSRCR